MGSYVVSQVLVPVSIFGFLVLQPEILEDILLTSDWQWCAIKHLHSILENHATQCYIEHQLNTVLTFLMTPVHRACSDSDIPWKQEIENIHSGFIFLWGRSWPGPRGAGLKITAGPWPFSVQNCQTANHFSKCLAIWANPKHMWLSLLANCDPSVIKFCARIPWSFLCDIDQNHWTFRAI